VCVTSRVIAANGISVLGISRQPKESTAMLKIYATRHTDVLCSDSYCIAAGDSKIVRDELGRIWKDAAVA
jgi:hypothetical protein